MSWGCKTATPILVIKLQQFTMFLPVEASFEQTFILCKNRLPSMQLKPDLKVLCADTALRVRFNLFEGLPLEVTETKMTPAGTQSTDYCEATTTLLSSNRSPASKTPPLATSTGFTIEHETDVSCPIKSCRMMLMTSGRWSCQTVHKRCQLEWKWTRGDFHSRTSQHAMSPAGRNIKAYHSRIWQKKSIHHASADGLVSPTKPRAGVPLLQAARGAAVTLVWTVKTRTGKWQQCGFKRKCVCLQVTQDVLNMCGYYGDFSYIRYTSKLLPGLLVAQNDEETSASLPPAPPWDVIGFTLLKNTGALHQTPQAQLIQ